MTARFEPYIVIHTLGAPLEGDDRAAYADFLNFLLTQGVLFYWNKFPNDIARALEGGFYDDEKGDFFGNTYLHVGLTFPNLPVRGAELWLGTWHREKSRAIRINLFGTDGISSADFDSLGIYLTGLSLLIHQKLGAMLTIMESSERALASYNPKTIPLWVGWHTIYGEAVQKKHGLSPAMPFPAGITASHINRDLMVRHSVSFSEHILKGWNAEQQNFWKSTGGRLLRKPGAYTLPPKDGETYIVDEVDEKGNIVRVKPLD